MQENREERKQRESGEVMLEAALIFPITLIFVMIMLSVGFLFYQKAMMQSVATEMASDIAAGYKYTDWEIWESELTEHQISSVKKYRMSLMLLSMKRHCKTKAQNYLGSRVDAASLGVTDEPPSLDSIKLKVDNVGRMHIEVKISMKSEILLEHMLEKLGILHETPVFTATAYAECMDITAYASQVRFLEYAEEKVRDNGGVVGAIMDELAKTVQNVKMSVDTATGSITNFVEEVSP
ncbi:MAG: TadE/TadG family type IV pilus assembly protein [Roseburia sp.]